MKKRYVLHPGWVRSSADGQQHWISAVRLSALYGVSMRECTVAKPHALYDCGVVHLQPSAAGDYRLPEA